MTKIKLKKINTQKSYLFHPLVITICLIVFLVFGNTLGFGNLTDAQNSSTNSKKISLAVPEGTFSQINEQVANSCVTELTKFADPEFEKYKIFMENNFKNKSTTTSLLNLGIQRYDQFKISIMSKYQDLIGQQIDLAARVGSNVANQGVGLNRCNILALQYIDDANQLLKMRAITTSGIKKTLIFVEKYKQINDKLRALNLEMLKMVVNISSFEQKLPCYLKSCV